MVETRTQLKYANDSIILKTCIIIVNNNKKCKILDMTIDQWLQQELTKYDVFVVDCKNGENLKEKIAIYLKNYNYFMIIYNNTPFITEEVVDRIFDYIAIKDAKACKLYSGAVYEVKNYLRYDNVMYDCFYMQDQECFRLIENDEDITLAEKFFTNKVIMRLRKNGIMIESPQSIIISPMASIGAGTTILHNCVIKGKTHIGKNCIINNNSTIIDSNLGDNVSVSNSIINKSKIGDNSIISPYCNINKATIDNDCYISYYCVVENSRVKKGANLQQNTTLRK